MGACDLIVHQINHLQFVPARVASKIESHLEYKL